MYAKMDKNLSFFFSTQTRQAQYKRVSVAYTYRKWGLDKVENAPIIAYCLLLTAYCLLLTAYCLLLRYKSAHTTQFINSTSFIKSGRSFFVCICAGTISIDNIYSHLFPILPLQSTSTHCAFIYISEFL